MRLDTIQRIERFITDALLSSNLIPLGVNVVRLAAEQDTEGITAMARSIVVRYTGSSIAVQQRKPMVIERTLRFEIIHSAQSYLTESGHEYAVQMCSGAYLTLNNHVPMNTGVQVIEPLHMTAENFDGLTDSSHYVYTQQWEMVAHEIYHLHAVDPCVERGNCTYLFPDDALSTMIPGDVIANRNELWSPVLRPHTGVPLSPPTGPGQVAPIIYPSPLDGETDGGNYNSRKCGVVIRDGDMYFKHEKERLFLSNWEDHAFYSTGTFDSSGEFLICTVRKRDTNDLVMVYYASNCDNRRLLDIGGDLYKSPIGKAGNFRESNGPLQFGTLASKNEFGYAKYNKVTIYIDPTEPEAATAQIKYGVVYVVKSGAILKHEDEEYYNIGGTSLGKVWVNTKDFAILDRRSTLDLDCELDKLHPGPAPCD